MAWFRLKRSFGTALALVALGLQLILSFGHSHHDFGRGSPSFDAVSAIAAAASGGADASAPPAGHPADDDDDVCAICAVVSLAGTARVAEPPSLPLPVEFVLVRLTGADAAIVVERPSIPFRSRAPPVV